MGLVYLANDRRTGLTVAIKVMSGRGSEPELEARLLGESRMLGTTDRRNILQFLEIARTDDGIPSIVMEVAEGADDEEILDVLDRLVLRAASEAAPVPVEESQQKRWPDLVETTDAPEPALEAPAVMAGPLSDKTERLDDVIAKLRAQPAIEPVPAAPPPQPVRPPEATYEPKRATEVAPAAQPSLAGRRLVVYGESPPPFVKTPPRPAPPRPAPPSSVPPAVAPAAAPSPDATGRRIRLIVVGLIVTAIVVLFAAILWVLVSLARGAASGESPRTSRGGSSRAVARAAHRSVDPKFE